MSPFSVRPSSPENARRRARMVLALVAVGIAASLLAYAISPSVRHAVGRAAHSVKQGVGHVLDHDTKSRVTKPATAPVRPPRAPATPSHAHSGPSTTPAPAAPG
jgi:hypothetical protein